MGARRSSPIVLSSAAHATTTMITACNLNLRTLDEIITLIRQLVSIVFVLYCWRKDQNINATVDELAHPLQ
ncbi:hypothetical protein PsYK624_160550 [Phanerochaete sordida]|uniref:Uncharacterized protein n=1 Tax=Phanerochaete sordida TaxID=48140 RepID=A0A9P3GUY1_9APHY|nr:hypothetical protein PsYK624_160550 [Phanerochaete sordida]